MSIKNWLCINTYAGRLKYPVEIVKETPKRYRVKILQDGTPLAGANRRANAGDVVLVPKYAVTDKPPQNANKRQIPRATGE